MVALSCAGTVISAAVAFGLVLWRFPADLVAGGTGVPVAAVGSALVVVAAVTVVLWRAVDRQLVARRHDHRNLPARPEFHGIGIAERPLHGDEIEGKTLRELRYVVFDTETTGLHPGDGDEIIAIAGVRLHDGEIDEAGTFSRLVHPGRTIPPASIRFHGITDDMVKGEAPITDVLPEFRDFVGDAVLVAHNADFDITFLKLKEHATGVEIANVVLDSLLISVFVDHASRNHTLDAVAERLGVEVEARHTALGDSIATARIFRKLLGRLEARGITTLGQLAAACAKIERARRSLGR